MTKRTLDRHMAAAVAIKEQIAALQQDLDKHQDAIKRGMEENAVTRYEHQGHKAIYQEVTSNRFNSAGFRKVHADLYEAFKRPVTSMQFRLD